MLRKTLYLYDISYLKKIDTIKKIIKVNLSKDVKWKISLQYLCLEIYFLEKEKRWN